ncbi:hypothetical protein ACFFX0_18660 [Citricoccus parietis]|uniref:Uncharacterized protein n=1 Tax=Citricoccus parietis TaxID=592307 RepID=A0ABV5G2F4_9MICC
MPFFLPPTASFAEVLGDHCRVLPRHVPVTSLRARNKSAPPWQRRSHYEAFGSRCRPVGSASGTPGATASPASSRSRASPTAGSPRAARRRSRRCSKSW